MAHERVVLDGFRYDVTPGQLWRSDKGVADRVVVLNLYDDERGIHVEAYFPEAAWPAFAADVQGGQGFSAEVLQRLGV